MIHTIIPITITPNISEDMAGDILRLRRAFFFATGCPAILPPPPGERKHRFKALIETIVECKKVFFILQIPRHYWNALRLRITKRSNQISLAGSSQVYLAVAGSYRY